MLKKVLPYQLDETGLSYLYRAIKTDDHSGTEDEVVAGIYNDYYQLWQWETNTENIVFITVVSAHMDGYRELVINMMSGRGAIMGQNEIMEAVRKQAAELNCSRVIAYVKPKLAESFGMASFDVDVTDRDVTVFDNIYLVVGMEV